MIHGGRSAENVERNTEGGTGPGQAGRCGFGALHTAVGDARAGVDQARAARNA